MTSDNGNGAPGGNKKIILVTGATGNQGGAAAAWLLTAGWRVRALTRDPASRGRPGAVTAGDLDDPGSLRAATDGVFSVELEAPTLRDTARRIWRPRPRGSAGRLAALRSCGAGPGAAPRCTSSPRPTNWCGTWAPRPTRSARTARSLSWRARERWRW